MKSRRLVAALPLLFGAFAIAAPAAEPDARSEYEKLKASARRDANAQVDLALWCERNGLTPEKFKHLALALTADPGHAKARGLMGLMEVAGRWETPAQAAEARAKDEAIAKALAEYADRRARVKENDADGQTHLAAWCEQNGLADEARAHWSIATRLDPSRSTAWRKLGFRKQDGRWVLPEQVAARQAEAKAQADADRRWTPELKRIKSQLDRPSQRDQAQAALDAIADPRAARAIMAVFGDEDAPNQRLAIDALARLEGVAATQGLAQLAVFAEDPEVRRVAGESLRSRDPREAVAALIVSLRDPVRYEVVPVAEGREGTITIKGKRRNIVRSYRLTSSDPRTAQALAPGLQEMGQLRQSITDAQAAWEFMGLDATTQLGFDYTPLAAERRVENLRNSNFVRPGRVWVTMAQDPHARLAALEVTWNAVTRQIAANDASVANRQRADAQALESYNEAAGEMNGRVGVLLRDITGRSIGDEEPDAWRTWYAQELGGQYTPPPERQVTVPTFYQTVAAPTPPIFRIVAADCFAAGTAVHTADGVRPIESIRPGDRVLSQDTGTGSLAYRPVLAAHRTPDVATMRVTTDDETITTTTYHRFWVAGQGWKMARELEPGDALRGLQGTVKVRSIEPDTGRQTVYNFDVDGDRNLFVGQAGWLAHDFSLPSLVDRPFDATTAAASR